MADFNKIYDVDVNPFTALTTVEYVDCADLTPEPNLIGKFAEGAVAQWMPNGAAAPIPIAAQADGTFFDRYDAPLTNLLNAFRGSGLTALYQLPDTSQVTDFSNMFHSDEELVYVDGRMFDTRNAVSLSSIFAICRKLDNLDVSRMDTSKCVNMSYLFYFCNALKTIDVSSWNTSNATTMLDMFTHCDSLTAIDLSKWDVSKVADMEGMFSQCGVLAFIMMNGFGAVENVNVTHMFEGCTKWGSGAANNLASLTATLVYNSFDRATAGYSTLTITLPQAVIGRLTTQNLALITKKGYTIAVQS